MEKINEKMKNLNENVKKILMELKQEYNKTKKKIISDYEKKFTKYEERLKKLEEKPKSIYKKTKGAIVEEEEFVEPKKKKKSKSELVEMEAPKKSNEIELIKKVLDKRKYNTLKNNIDNYLNMVKDFEGQSVRKDVITRFNYARNQIIKIQNYIINEVGKLYPEKENHMRDYLQENINVNLFNKNLVALNNFIQKINPK